jgi:Domain of unknown function (DUF4136)
MSTPKARAVGKFRLAAPVLGILVLAGVVAAQKLEVKTDKDPSADFTALRTYAWLPPAPVIKNVAPGVPTNPTLSQEVLGPHITAAVDRQLAARGLTKVEPDAADVHVVYMAALTTGFSHTYLGEYYGYVTGWGSPIPPGLAPSTSATIYEKGTVVVDMVERASKRAIWRGSVVTRVHQETKLEKRIERINDGTERMFERFPIRPKK